MQSLLKQQKELAEEIQAQQSARDKLEQQHKKAKNELCELTAKFAEEQISQTVGQEATGSAQPGPWPQA
eukprot:7943516-Karenia_brevis.AAC.1